MEDVFFYIYGLSVQKSILFYGKGCFFVLFVLGIDSLDFLLNHF